MVAPTLYSQVPTQQSREAYLQQLRMRQDTAMRIIQQKNTAQLQTIDERLNKINQEIKLIQQSEAQNTGASRSKITGRQLHIQYLALEGEKEALEKARSQIASGGTFEDLSKVQESAKEYGGSLAEQERRSIGQFESKQVNKEIQAKQAGYSSYKEYISKLKESYKPQGTSETQYYSPGEGFVTPVPGKEGKYVAVKLAGTTDTGQKLYSSSTGMLTGEQFKTQQNLESQAKATQELYKKATGKDLYQVSKSDVGENKEGYYTLDTVETVKPYSSQQYAEYQKKQFLAKAGGEKPSMQEYISSQEYQKSLPQPKPTLKEKYQTFLGNVKDEFYYLTHPQKPESGIYSGSVMPITSTDLFIASTGVGGIARGGISKVGTYILEKPIKAGITTTGYIFSKPITQTFEKGLDIVLPRPEPGKGYTIQALRGVATRGVIFIPGIGTAVGSAYTKEITKGLITAPKETVSSLVGYAKDYPFEIGGMFLAGGFKKGYNKLTDTKLKYFTIEPAPSSKAYNKQLGENIVPEKSPLFTRITTEGETSGRLTFVKGEFGGVATGVGVIAQSPIREFFGLGPKYVSKTMEGYKYKDFLGREKIKTYSQKDYAKVKKELTKRLERRTNLEKKDILKRVKESLAGRYLQDYTITSKGIAGVYSTGQFELGAETKTRYKDFTLEVKDTSSKRNGVAILKSLNKKPKTVTSTLKGEKVGQIGLDTEAIGNIELYRSIGETIDKTKKLGKQRIMEDIYTALKLKESYASDVTALYSTKYAKGVKVKPVGTELQVFEQVDAVKLLTEKLQQTRKAKYGKVSRDFTGLEFNEKGILEGIQEKKLKDVMVKIKEGSYKKVKPGTEVYVASQEPIITITEDIPAGKRITRFGKEDTYLQVEQDLGYSIKESPIIIKSEPKVTLYHGTTFTSAQKALKEGLKPASEVGISRGLPIKLPEVFATPELERARGWAGRAVYGKGKSFGEKPAILQIKIPETKYKELAIRRNFEKGGGVEVALKEIPPEYIKLYKEEPIIEKPVRELPKQEVNTQQLQQLEIKEPILQPKKLTAQERININKAQAQAKTVFDKLLEKQIPKQRALTTPEELGKLEKDFGVSRLQVKAIPRISPVEKKEQINKEMLKQDLSQREKLQIKERLGMKMDLGLNQQLNQKLNVEQKLNQEMRQEMKQEMKLDQRLNQKLNQQMKLKQEMKLKSRMPLRTSIFERFKFKPIKEKMPFMLKEQEKKKKKRFEKSYRLFKISKGKPIFIGGGLSREAALDIGTKETLKTLGATFFLEKGSEPMRDVFTGGEFQRYKSKFRTPTLKSKYKKYGDVFVQRQAGKGGRLFTRGEKLDIQMAKRKKMEQYLQ